MNNCCLGIISVDGEERFVGNVVLTWCVECGRLIPVSRWDANFRTKLDQYCSRCHKDSGHVDLVYYLGKHD